MSAKHLVARCPVCERSIWPKSMAKLLGLVAFSAAPRQHVAFIAEGKVGQRGWRFSRSIDSLTSLELEAGGVAVEQLKRLAKLGFERMWLAGLLSRDVVDSVTRTESLPRASEARPSVSFSQYSFSRPERSMTEGKFSL